MATAAAPVAEFIGVLDHRKITLFSLRFDLLLVRSVSSAKSDRFCVQRDTVRYFIGAQIASLLGRETFNLYRSFKVRNAEPHQVALISSSAQERALRARFPARARLYD